MTRLAAIVTSTGRLRKRRRSPTNFCIMSNFTASLAFDALLWVYSLRSVVLVAVVWLLFLLRVNTAKELSLLGGVLIWREVGGRIDYAVVVVPVVEGSFRKDC